MCSQQVQQTVVILFSCHVTIVLLYVHTEKPIYILVRPGRDRLLMNSSSLRSDPTEEAGVSNGRTTMSVPAEAYHAPQLTLSTVQDGIYALGKAYALHPVSQKYPQLNVALETVLMFV